MAQPTAPPVTATTAEVAEAAKLNPETIRRLRRMGQVGPFKEHRDWIHIGLGQKKLGWNKNQALQSLWAYKRQPAQEVETFSRPAIPANWEETP